MCKLYRVEYQAWRVFSNHAASRHSTCEGGWHGSTKGSRRSMKSRLSETEKFVIFCHWRARINSQTFLMVWINAMTQCLFCLWTNLESTCTAPSPPASRSYVAVLGFSARNRRLQKLYQLLPSCLVMHADHWHTGNVGTFCEAAAWIVSRKSKMRQRAKWEFLPPPSISVHSKGSLRSRWRLPSSCQAEWKYIKVLWDRLAFCLHTKEDSRFLEGSLERLGYVDCVAAPLDTRPWKTTLTNNTNQTIWFTVWI